MTKNQFFRILKENDAYVAYIRNMSNPSISIFPEYEKYKLQLTDKVAINVKEINAFIDKCVKENKPADAINYGFSWNLTNEGEDFWINIFRQILINENQNKKGVF